MPRSRRSARAAPRNFSSLESQFMSLQYRAAVLHRSGTPLAIETVVAGEPAPTDVVVRVRAAGLCHTDLEVIDGSLRYPLPMILGHEAAGVVERVGADAGNIQVS